MEYSKKTSNCKLLLLDGYYTSVHDCILMPKSESTLEELQEMVYEVNRETVSREDRLSDDIYFFDSITKEITMVSGQREISKQQEPKVTGEQRR